MVDIARDARWGRVMEGSGEDPDLSGCSWPPPACADSRAATSAPSTRWPRASSTTPLTGFAESGRDYNTVDISEQTLTVALPPFKAAAEAVTFMELVQRDIGGIPATGSVHLQRDILKGEWGFQGFVVSGLGLIGDPDGSPPTSRTPRGLP